MTLQEQILSFYYRWHRMEAANQVDIIDFDLVGRKDAFPGAFQNREEVKATLQGLMYACEAQPGVHPFLKKKLVASWTYLGALMGESFDFETYVTRTMGIRPTLIPEPFLAQELAKAKVLLGELGYEYTTEGLSAFRQETMYSSADEIRDAFKAFEHRIVPMVSAWLGLSFDIDYGIEFVEKDAYWLNWVSTDDNGRILLRFNLHPRKRDSWQKGTEEVMVFHEICGHVLQSLGWQKALREGQLDPALGLTTVFTPEQFVSEGIAQSLTFFFPNPPWSRHGAFHSQNGLLRTLVANNAHIMTNQGASDERIFDFMKAYLPLSRVEEVAKNMTERREHPLFRTYQYVYGISAYHHQLLADRLSPEARKQYVLDIYREPLLPAQVLERG